MSHNHRKIALFGLIASLALVPRTWRWPLGRRIFRLFTQRGQA